MRISTGMIFESGLNSIQDRTSTLLRTQQQLAAGRRILSPSDDPVAAARALEITQAKTVGLTQATTRDNAKSSLGLVDAQIQSSSDLMMRVRELTVQAGNSTLTASDRRSIATELRARFEEMVALANSRDGTGLYLFGGYQTGNKPFAGSVENGVRYGGDGGIRTLGVSSSRDLPISDSGDDLFMRVQNGNGVFLTGMQNEKIANARSVVYESALTSLTNPPPTTGSFELRFWVDTASTPSTTYYDLVDAAGNSLVTGTPSQTGPGGTYLTYVPGTALNLSNAGPPAFDYGTTVYFTGAPQTGDSFLVNRTATDLTLTPENLAQRAQATINSGQVTNPLRWSDPSRPESLELRFWTDSNNDIGGGYGQIYYDIVNASTGHSLYTGAASQTGALPGGSFRGVYTSGQPIHITSAPPHPPHPLPPTAAFDFGAVVTVTGRPANGDSFVIRESAHHTGNGAFVTEPKTSRQLNTGSGIIGVGEVLDVSKWNVAANSRNLEVRFWQDPLDTGTPPATFYDLVDAETERSLFTNTLSTMGGANNTFTRRFEPGDSISFSGLHPAFGIGGAPGDFGVSVTIQGEPASGDAFTLRASGTESVFDTLASLIQNLENGNPAGTMGGTFLGNEIGRLLNQISNIEDNFLRVRASIGTRLAEIDDLHQLGQNMNLQYEETLSRLQDLDYAEAITRLTRQQMELQAAQQSFTRIAQLSLFNYL